MEWDKERKKLTKVYNYVLTVKKIVVFSVEFASGTSNYHGRSTSENQQHKTKS